MINDDMPRSSDHTPILSYYILIQMLFLLVAILGQGMAFKCVAKMEQISPVPLKIYKISMIIGKLLRIEIPNEKATSEMVVQLRRKSVAKYENGGDNEEQILRKYVRRLTIIQAHGDDGGEYDDDDDEEEAKNEEIRSPDVVQIEMNRKRKSTAIVNDQLALTREVLERLQNTKRNSFIKSQWLFMIETIDRCIFIIYSLGIVTTPLVFFVILPNI